MFKICHRYGLFTVAFFMVGTPSETKEDMEISRALIRDIHPDVVAISITTPIIGSMLYMEAIKDGTLNICDSSDYSYYGVRNPIKLKLLTENDIIQYKKQLVWAWTLSIYKNLPKYLSWLFSASKIRILLLISRRSLMTRLKWLNWQPKE